VLAAQVLGGDGDGDDGAVGEGEASSQAGQEASGDGQDGPESGATSETSETEDIPSPGESDGPSDSDAEEEAYALLDSDVELAITAPIFRHDTSEYNDRCSGGNLTKVELDNLEVTEGQSYGTDYFPPDVDFQYSYCDHPGLIDNGIEFNPEIFAGLINDPNATPEECYEAAHTPTLPHLVPVEDIWEDTTLHEDMGLCVETEDGNVVLLWFTRATADPYNEDLRTYLTTVTRWAPNP